ncbi:16S rRNA (cytosine(967)-C(5))-methyltransferase RsmB [Companilactobacillus sp. DQM5]|uniref:16S rRNA (cytosine(967)-C(5))-methyltransferase RsmB n=1 Tax=Companilactobacillus sp. DQM5 TaxID=3463359 RepID=UPI004059F572
MLNSARYNALNILEKILIDESYSNIEINNVIKRDNLSSKDVALMTNIVYGVLQHKLTIDFYLQDYLKGKKIDSWVNILLLLSIYQFEYLDKVPDRAVIYESVEIAKKRGNRGIGGFVNGVLRNYQRNGHKNLNIIKDYKNRLSVEFSMPLWIIEKLSSQLGMDKTENIIKSLNHSSRLSLRVNTKKINRDELISKLSKKNIEVQKSEISPFGIMTSDNRVINSEEFLNGLYTIQDESSMLVAPALQVEKNSKVLDACAAPGGKTTHIASYLDSNEEGSVTALDIYDHKVKLIEENAYRLGMSDLVYAKKLDALNIESLDMSFDRILVDAPCSGLGLLRRKPEMRYFRKPEDINELTLIQKEILNSVSKKLKINGILVYSTCTIVDDENERTVQQFLENNDNFEQIDVKNDIGISKNKMVKLYPDDYETDGFFISAFKRIK